MTRLVWFTAAWVSGILLAQAARFPLIWLALGLPAALILWAGWGSSPWARRGSAALIGLVLGAARLAVSQPALTEDTLAFYNDQSAVGITGVVIQEPDEHAAYTQVVLRATSVTLADGETRQVKGKVLVRLPSHSQISYGDELDITGTPVTPADSDEFAYRSYLAQRGILSLVRAKSVMVRATHRANPIMDVILGLKAQSHAVLLTSLPEPQASLLSGILLGIESGIPEELNEAFRATGTSHIVAISGFNLMLVAGVFSALAKRALGSRGQTPVALAGIWIYTLLVGASAAVLRAAVMASLAVVAHREQRRVHGPTSLAGAALLMTLLNPFILWDVGFQLSLAATLGLMVYTDPFSKGFETLVSRLSGAERTQRVVGWLSDAVIVTLAAQITTTPILAARFGRLSLVSLLVNLLIVPVQPFVMLFGGITLLAGLIAQPLGQVLGWLAWVFLSYTIFIVQSFASLRFASVTLEQVTLAMVWGSYGALAGVTWWASLTKGRRKELWDRVRVLPAWGIAMGLAALVLLTIGIGSLPDGRLHITFLDVGLGDATLIETPRGRTILIDGGPDSTRALAEIGKRLPFWKRRIDLVILTSPDVERVEGLIPVLERYTVSEVATGMETATSNAYRHWQELLAARGSMGVEQASALTTWMPDSGVELRVLWPYPEGEPGPLVLQLSYGNTRVLIPGDATTVIEEALVTAYGEDLRSQVLLMPRHGAPTSGMPAFLEAVSPELVVISTASDSTYPSPYALARLMDIPVYRTDVHQAIQVITNGTAFRVKTGR